MTTHVEADCRLDVDTGSIPVASTIFIVVLSFDVLSLLLEHWNRYTVAYSMPLLLRGCI